jgi:hypothetical protein
MVRPREIEIPKSPQHLNESRSFGDLLTQFARTHKSLSGLRRGITLRLTQRYAQVDLQNDFLFNVFGTNGQSPEQLQAEVELANSLAVSRTPHFLLTCQMQVSNGFPAIGAATVMMGQSYTALLQPTRI